MSMQARTSIFGSDARFRLFKAAKYAVYLLLSFNIYLFLQEELLALSFTFADGIEPGQLIQAFSATIDTAAWVILLLMFELETSVLDDRKIRGPVKWGLHGLRGFCYIALTYAFTGYYQELVTLYEVAPLAIGDACSLVAADYSLLVDLDEYLPLDIVNCATLSGQVFALADFNILADGETLHALIEREEVTVASGVPTIWLALLDYLEKSGNTIKSVNRGNPTTSKLANLRGCGRPYQ